MTKKTATKKTATKKTAEAMTPKETYQNRMRKLAPQHRLAAKLAATVDRFKHLVDEVVVWKNAGELVSTAKKAFAGIEEFADEVASLPADFVVERARKSAVSNLTAGMFVNLREKHGETYDGIVDGKDRIRLEDLGTRKGRVVCKTASGEKIILPRGHVEIAAAPAKKAAA
jgi:hypothetical protein